MPLYTYCLDIRAVSITVHTASYKDSLVVEVLWSIEEPLDLLPSERVRADLDTFSRQVQAVLLGSVTGPGGQRGTAPTEGSDTVGVLEMGKVDPAVSRPTPAAKLTNSPSWSSRGPRRPR